MSNVTHEAGSFTDGELSPRTRLPQTIPNEQDRRKVVPSSRRQSTSVTCVEKGEDDDGVASKSKSHKETKSDKFFQYNMSHKDRGIFVIFNHKKFSTSLTARERTGTDTDRDNLFETARELGFTVFKHDNLTARALLMAVKQYADIDYTDCDCFACAILTHGDSGDVLYAKDQKYSIQDILSPFKKSASLKGKPKLFFVQACRGREFDQGTSAASADSGVFEDSGGNAGASIPLEADFFIGYSTVEGYYAWRNGEDGSWFIQALCYCLRKFGKELELMQIMTRVNRMVAYDFESNVSNPLYNKKKQMPSLVTRLTGDVYFTHQPQRSKTVTDASPASETRTISLTDKKHRDEGVFVKAQLLKMKLELTKLRREKAEVEGKEQELLGRVLEYKISRLQH